MCEAKKVCSICKAENKNLVFVAGMIHSDALPLDVAKSICYPSGPSYLNVSSYVCVPCYCKRDMNGLLADIITANVRKSDEARNDILLGHKIVDLARSVSAWYEIEKENSFSAFDSHYKICPVCGVAYYVPHKAYCFVPLIEEIQAITIKIGL